MYRGNCTFWEWLLSTWCLWENLLALWDGQSSETDTFLRVQNGSLPHKGLNSSGTTIDLIKGNLTDDLGAITPKCSISLKLSVTVPIQLTFGAS
jgi:hypothetical protein